MKTLFSIFVCLGILLALPYLFHTPETHEYLVFGDITDSGSPPPDLTVFKTAFALGEHPSRGITLRYRSISDLSLEGEQVIALPPSHPWLSNQLERDRHIASFLGAVDSLDASIKSISQGRNTSSIYVPLAKELNALSKREARQKTAVIFSDLLEHGDLSFYRPQTFHHLLAKPDSIASYLHAQVPLADLTGIDVYLVFQPTTPLEDSRFQAVSSLYERMLTSQGARVFIQARFTPQTQYP